MSTADVSTPAHRIPGIRRGRRRHPSRRAGPRARRWSGHHALGVAVLAALIAIGGPRPAGAEPPPLEAAGNHPFTADVLVFHTEGSDQGTVWITLDLAVTHLFFEPGETSTEYVVAWQVRRGGTQVDGDVLTQSVTVDDPVSEDRHVLQVIPIRLDPGRYQLQVELGQPGTERRSRVKRDLRIDSISESPFTLSTMYLSAEPASRIVARPAGDLGFPIVSRVVGRDATSLTLVGELYAPHGCRERYRVSYRLVDDYERTLQARTEELPCEGFRTLVMLPLDTGSLGFGDYRVEVSVKIPRESHEIYREIWFSADESLLSLRTGFSETLEIIDAIASDDELDELRNVAPEDRAEAWAAFWAERDPDPSTPTNEYRDDFFRRLRFANQHFGTGTQPGWKTDRGFVLLQNGHPDRIDRTPSSGGRPWVEVWYYAALGREFRFVDEIGLGDYHLVQVFR